MAEESTDGRERMNRSSVPASIASLEEEIERSRRNASSIVREIKSRAANFARSELRNRIVGISEKAANAAARAGEAAWSRTSGLRSSLNRIDGKTVLYVAGGVLAAGSLAAIAITRSGKRRREYKRIPIRTTGEEREGTAIEPLIAAPAEENDLYKRSI